MGVSFSLVLPLYLPFSFRFEEHQESQSQSLHSFYKASGSEPPLPDEVAESLVKWGLPQGVTLMCIVLMVPSFRLGLLLLCGYRYCFDWKWPFIHKFCELSLGKREEILKKWSLENSLIPLRTDENSRNLAWEAIGYQVNNTRKTLEKKLL